MFDSAQVCEIMKHIEDISDDTVKLYVAGGYLRDTMNGLPPKDVDIMVVPNKGESVDAWDMSGILGCTEFHVRKEWLEECQYMSDMQKRGVVGLIMGEYNGVEVQFILYDDYMTQEQVTHDMDINICQITMDSDSNVVESDNFVAGFANNEITLHHEYSEKRKQSRIDRMVAKYPTFTYAER